MTPEHPCLALLREASAVAFESERTVEAELAFVRLYLAAMQGALDELSGTEDQRQLRILRAEVRPRVDPSEQLG